MRYYILSELVRPYTDYNSFGDLDDLSGDDDEDQDTPPANNGREDLDEIDLDELNDDEVVADSYDDNDEPLERHSGMDDSNSEESDVIVDGSVPHGYGEIEQSNGGLEPSEETKEARDELGTEANSSYYDYSEDDE